MINLDTQLFILLYSFLSGIIFGIGFDIYKIIFIFRGNKALNLIRDVMYFFVVGVLVFYFLLYTEYAIFSIYTYFYMFLGLIFYLKCISRFILPIVKWVLRVIGLIFRYLSKYIPYFILKFNIKKNS